MTPASEEQPEWADLCIYPDHSRAEVDAAYLRSEGLDAHVVVVETIPVPGRARLVVAAGQVGRAQWLLKIPPVTEAELDFLATGLWPSPGPDERNAP